MSLSMSENVETNPKTPCQKHCPHVIRYVMYRPLSPHTPHHRHHREENRGNRSPYSGAR
jgi:hypothetical protein